MKEEALLLTDGSTPSAYRNATKVLDFFGVPWRVETIQEFVRSSGVPSEGFSKIRLFASSDVFPSLLKELEGSSRESWMWSDRVHSAFVYAGENAEEFQELARKLTSDSHASIKTADRYLGDFSISKVLTAFCGVMAGVRIAPPRTATAAVAISHAAEAGVVDIISLDQGAALLKLEYQNVTIFLSTSKSVVDLEAELATGIFDIRDYALTAVPIVLYIKWAFAGTGWGAPEANACLIIDDPLLRPTYGFVDFHELFTLMKRHRFSTNVAFIPWNWRRTAPAVAQLFTENSNQFSLSIHGCDHTRAEFGSTDREWIYGKAKQAVERMVRHESKTGIGHDRVMVFPQGVFSGAAMGVLKQTEIIAAVNNDIISNDPNPRAIKISEVWDIAFMGYDNYPIFSRRYPWEGSENFAFDILLGKPCIAVIHHDFCKDQCERLVDFVERLNALNCPLAWRSLGDVVRRSYRQRQISEDEIEVEMYGTEVRLENSSTQTRKFIVKRRESDPAEVKDFYVGSRKIAWNSDHGYILAVCQLEPRESETVCVTFHNHVASEGRTENVRYRMKTMLRRYLSEARDNYVIRYAPPFLSRFIRVN